MAKVIFTPWKDASELLSVRSFFYPAESYDGTDMRSTACAIVAAWKLRGHLPHAVEATALLTDAILHDDAKKNSIFAIRATYSAAFCRFVTALVDSKQPGQRKTMFQRAMDLGLPASFVELRHEATHREPPSLVVLRNATQRSLEWLWDYYWAKADPDATFLPPPPAEADDEEGLRVLRDAVRDCVRLFLEEGEQQQNQQEQQQQQQPARKKRRVQTLMGTSLATRLGSVCREKEGRRAVCGGLVEEGALVSGERRLDDSMDDTFSRWNPCLQTLTDNCPAFLTSLAEEMVDVLAFTAVKANSKEKDDAYREGIFLWLDHILRSTEWASHRRVLSLVYVRAACQASSGHWMQLLKRVVDALSSGESLRRAEAVLEADSMQVDGDVDGSARELGKYGWEMDGAWDSRPLGVA